jgi:hypothetical protein
MISAHKKRRPKRAPERVSTRLEGEKMAKSAVPGTPHQNLLGELRISLDTDL